jgi:signal transduction histidine kinase/ActR/RegA family two-component response regulator
MTSAVAVAVLEAVSVGYLVRRLSLHVLSAAVLFRGVVALVILLLPTSQNAEEAYIAVIQDAVSAVLSAGVLQWALLVLNVGTQRAHRRGIRRSFRGHLYEGFTTLGVVMVLILVLGFARWLGNRITNDIEFQLEVAARTVSIGVNQYLSDHAQAVSMLAATLDETGAAWDPPRLKAWLKRFSHKYPSFQSVLSVDRQGTILAVHATGSTRGQVRSTSGHVARAEPYFLEPKRTGKPYVSNAFQELEIARDPLVAISAPLRNDGGGFAGVVGGFLNLRLMGGFKRYKPGVDDAAIVIVDRAKRVVFAGSDTPYKALEDVSSQEFTSKPLRADEATTIRYKRKGPESGEDEELLAGCSVVTDYGWSVCVEAPANLMREELLSLHARSAGWAGLGIAFCFLLARVVAGRYTRPLEDLVHRVGGLSPSGAQEHLQPDASVPREVASLIDSFADLSNRLVRADAERRAVLANLEEAVRARTLELEEARALAEEATRVKSVFLASMSHEIRTPLNGVLGTMHLLERTGLDREQREYTGIALQAAESLLVILNDILDLSKIEAGRLKLENEPFDLVKCLDASVDLFRIQAYAKGLKLATLWQSETPLWVIGDSGRLRQVLSNLLSNALKFTPSGTITVSANWERKPDGVLLLEAAVHDTGVGIPEETRNRLFTPFMQGDDSRRKHPGGTGLGLAISKQLVEAMGGEISVESEAGKGSTFRFLVKLRAVSARDVAVRDHATRPDEFMQMKLAGTRILLVEDEPVNRLVARQLLTKLGCYVAEARTGVEALEAMSEGAFDLILMDCQMPEMDGYEATRRIRAREEKQHIPIVAITAYAMSGDREKCLAAGMNDFMAKPVHPVELTAVLSRVLGGSGLLQSRTPSPSIRQVSA